MRTVIFMLKWASQVIILVVGVSAAWRTHFELTEDGKRKLKWAGLASIALLTVNFLLFAISDIQQQKDLSALRNRDIAGIQISFTPTNEEWSRIDAAFERIPRFVAEIPNSAAGMTAERNMDNWKILFDPIKSTQGTMKFPILLSSDPRQKPFVDVINEAVPALWIKWAANVETEIEPRGYLYPTAIYISKDKIFITLRPPELRLKVNQLNQDFAISVRSDRRPANLRFLSLDDNVQLDQTVNLQWREDGAGGQSAKEDFIKRTKPYLSGPHKLQVTLKN